MRRRATLGIALVGLLGGSCLALRYVRIGGLTLPMFASGVSAAPVIRALLVLGGDPHAEAWGADPVEGIPDGVTSLWVAAAAGDVEAVQTLLDAGADPNQVGRRVPTRRATSLPLCMALFSKEPTAVAIADALLRHGASVTTVSWDGRTSAFTCIGRGDLKAKAELLLRYGAPKNGPARRGRPPIVHLVSEGWDEAIEPLLSSGAEVDARGRNGETALMVAAGRGHLITVQRLIAAGADATLRDNAGRTAEDYQARKRRAKTPPVPGGSQYAEVGRLLAVSGRAGDPRGRGSSKSVGSVGSGT